MSLVEQDLRRRLTLALRDGATADELAAMRFDVRSAEIHEVHNALTAAIEAAFGEKAAS